MLRVILSCEAVEAQIQKRYLDAELTDLCIDEGSRLMEVTSDRWLLIGAGTKMVLRVVFEQERSLTSLGYQCYLCATWTDPDSYGKLESPYAMEWSVFLLLWKLPD